MGYYTYHSLQVFEEDKDELEAGNTIYDAIREAYQKECSEDVFQDTQKWYSEEDTSKKISLMFPDYFIRIDGDGEESGDVWSKIYKSGQLIKEWHLDDSTPSIHELLN